MDLPIDHFRLLGVSPSADPATVLGKLQSRIESPPDQGFTHEALVQRDALLKRSADLLTDQERRAEYESALLNLSETHPNETVGLDLSASSEVSGLILLWEAHAAMEAFQLARQGLQPPQAPALGSGREADLTLLAALACRDAASEEQRQRRYESAANLLREGLELQKRMGKLPDQQQILEQALEQLLPYRILDLLSRDLGDQDSHQQGLLLLDQMVMDRGGLEGNDEKLIGISGLSQADFEPFFKQIRRFLTVQEQIDLFNQWSEQGSPEAGCLAVFALTAAGFSRRKPERLEEARDQLRGLKTPDLDPMPLLGCLDLLLGNVTAASEHFRAIRQPELRLWLDQHPGDELAAQCEYCRVWLERDVLPGYRDVESSDVDLDAWFADRDVQAYVDRLDRQRARRTDSTAEIPADWPSLLDPFAVVDPNSETSPSSQGEDSLDESNHRMQWVIPGSVRSWGIAGACAVVVLLLGFAAIRLRPQKPVPATAQPELNEAPPNEAPPNDSKLESSPKANLKSESEQGNQLKPLIKDEPTEAELQNLIQAWLDRKAAVLAGDSADTVHLRSVAKNQLVNRVLDQRAADASTGFTMAIDASVTSLELVSRTPQRIEVQAQIAYSDETLNASEQVVSKTPADTRTVRYIFGRDDAQQWKLVEYIPGA